MSYKQATSLTQKVELSAGYSAQVRALRADEEDAIQAIFLGAPKQRASVKTIGSGNTQQVETDSTVDFDTSAKIKRTLLFGVVSWTLDGDPGDDVDAAGILKITESNLRILTGGDRNKLFLAITNLTEPPALGEGDASQNGATPSSKEIQIPA